MERITRRAVLGGAVAVVAAGLGGVTWAAREGALPLPGPIARRVADQGPDGAIPAAPPGDERVTPMSSAARGRDVSFYTAVPDGHGDGRGLPVCLILHGSSATADRFAGFGFGRFLTDAVRRGAAPFVLAGATGRPEGWDDPSGGDDPMAMARDEIPAWCAARGFDTSRMVAWGWSLGGRGVLRLAEDNPGRLRAVAAFSPAISTGDAVFDGADRLLDANVALWCGESDGFYDATRALGRRIHATTAYDKGAHTRSYWNRVTPAAFDFAAAHLTP
jgi:S-formylglutathione hydrolase FrmB